jgi:hypothetical protein
MQHNRVVCDDRVVVSLLYVCVCVCVWVGEGWLTKALMMVVVDAFEQRRLLHALLYVLLERSTLPY